MLPTVSRLHRCFQLLHVIIKAWTYCRLWLLVPNSDNNAPQVRDTYLWHPGSLSSRLIHTDASCCASRPELSARSAQIVGMLRIEYRIESNCTVIAKLLQANDSLKGAFAALVCGFPLQAVSQTVSTMTQTCGKNVNRHIHHIWAGVSCINTWTVKAAL